MASGTWDGLAQMTLCYRCDLDTGVMSKAPSTSQDADLYCWDLYCWLCAAELCTDMGHALLYMSSWPSHLVVTSSRSALTVSVGDHSREVPEAYTKADWQGPQALPVIKVTRPWPVVPQGVLHGCQECV
jgi:hypothetical protein